MWWRTQNRSFVIEVNLEVRIMTILHDGTRMLPAGKVFKLVNHTDKCFIFVSSIVSSSALEVDTHAYLFPLSLLSIYARSVSGYAGDTSLHVRVSH